MRKSKYTILFEDLYEQYKSSTDKNAVWTRIFKSLKEFKIKLLSSSALFAEYYDEVNCDLDIAIFDSFNTFKEDRGASLYSWCYRLCSQAIWRFIKSKSGVINCDYLEEINLPDFETISPEEEMINAEMDIKTEKLKEKLKLIFDGPIEFEVFSMMNGIFEYDKMKIKEISEDINFSVNTIYLINQKNNRTIKQLREYLLNEGKTIEEFDPNDFNKKFKTKKICYRPLF